MRINQTIFFFLVLGSALCAVPVNFEWQRLTHLPPLGQQHESLGVAGAFAGIQQNTLLMAGGANFPKPFWENKKAFHTDISALFLDSDNFEWKHLGHLPEATAHGAGVSTEKGLVCIGGSNGKNVSDALFRLSIDPLNQEISRTDLPTLPRPCVFGSAVVLGETIYVAGGCYTSDLSSAMTNFWALDLNAEGTEEFTWRELPAWPGPSRAFSVLAGQFNGFSECLYLISGRRVNERGEIQFLTDVYEFDPMKLAQNESAWKKNTDVPRGVMAGPATPIGQSHIAILGGDDGFYFNKADSLQQSHPGFPKEILLYHTITDTWSSGGVAPENMVATSAIPWNNTFIIPGGEVRPRERSTNVWQLSLRSRPPAFGRLNFGVVIVYLAGLLFFGFYFSKNETTDDFFRGGQRVPWWAAGLSIFATLLSSVTFIAIPAKAYMTNWLLIFINLAIFAVAPFVIHFIIPFFRHLDVTSAYEYLEKRFNIHLRLFASFSFILFQIGRMAIVMFLPALALATITALPVTTCILIMGLLSLIYCTLGGVRAVIWTDAVQSIVLLGGALISLILILVRINGGVSGLFSTALASHKLSMVQWDWHTASITTSAIWVVVLGGVAQQLVTYTSDQAVVQRYMSVSDEKRAARATWTNAIVSLPATLLFFGLGAALFVFYKNFPERLDATFPNDAIFPLFIARELPVGVAGLLVAGIFAAAQSTVSTSMNSTATAFITDFIRRFHLLKSERGYLALARIMTVVFGVMGTTLALLFALSDVKSMWDAFMTILGLFGGLMCGLFLLGLFTTRATAAGALIGALTGAVGLYLVHSKTDVSYLLYAAVGILFCFGIGYVSSLFTRQTNNLQGLTIYTRQSSS